MSLNEKAQYDDFAPQYESAVDLPCCKLEGELVRQALDNCVGQRVLDLGGGSGIHARRAIEAGAASVDVVDISLEMLRVGEKVEVELGRTGRIRWFKADATKSLASQLGPEFAVEQCYDIVMVNWTLDNATSLEGLRGMWENAVSNLKPGGRFLGTRLQNIRALYMNHGKYGNKFVNFEAIPGGQQYTVECLTQPPFGWDCVAMDAVYPLKDEIPKELGLVDFQVLDPRRTVVVQEGSGYWDDFLQDPFFAMVVARKTLP